MNSKTHSSQRLRLKYIATEKISGEEAQFFSQAQYESFKSSISDLGIIEPLTVRKTGHEYTLISGAKRLKVAKDLGISSVPCVVTSCNDLTADKLSLAANCQRFKGSFVTTAEGLKRLIYTYGMPIEDAASVAGLSLEDTTELLHTLRLGTKLLSAIRKIGFTEKHAKALLRLGDENIRETALCEMAYCGISGDDANGYVDKLLNRGEEPAQTPPRKIYVMKDVRFFLNSVSHGIDIIRSSGIDAKCSHVSEDDGIVLTIKIPNVTEELNVS